MKNTTLTKIVLVILIGLIILIFVGDKTISCLGGDGDFLL